MSEGLPEQGSAGSSSGGFLPDDDRGHVYITDPDHLDDVAAELMKCDVVGVDVESDSFYSFEEKTCLIQVTGSRPGPDYIIDPLELEDLDPLAEVLADSSIQ